MGEHRAIQQLHIYLEAVGSPHLTLVLYLGTSGRVLGPITYANEVDLVFYVA